MVRLAARHLGLVRNVLPVCRAASTTCRFMSSMSQGHDPHPPKTMPSFSMQGKVCMVTGAARGLGYEFCRAFVSSGCTSLAILDLREEEAREKAAEIAAFGRESGSAQPLAVVLSLRLFESTATWIPRA